MNRAARFNAVVRLQSRFGLQIGEISEFATGRLKEGANSRQKCSFLVCPSNSPVTRFRSAFGMDRRSGYCARPAGWPAPSPRGYRRGGITGRDRDDSNSPSGKGRRDPVLALLLATTLGLLDRSENVRSNLSSPKARTCDVELPRVGVRRSH